MSTTHQSITETLCAQPQARPHSGSNCELKVFANSYFVFYPLQLVDSTAINTPSTTRYFVSHSDNSLRARVAIEQRRTLSKATSMEYATQFKIQFSCREPQHPTRLRSWFKVYSLVSNSATRNLRLLSRCVWNSHTDEMKRVHALAEGATFVGSK